MVSGEILVVDDTVANLDLVSQILEDAGYDVATALDGEHALKLANTHPPDLILLDVQMPKIDGFETCQQLKESFETAIVPIIFMTALDDIKSKVRGFDLGAVDYITKPFQEKELLARVKTHLQLRQWSKSLEERIAERTCELQEALEQLKQSQVRLVQAEKMSALGNLVASVAHEINNPIGFLNGSICNAKDYVNDLLHHLKLYQEQYSNTNNTLILENAKLIDLDFLCSDLPELLGSMQGATDRIKNISTSLRTFSRADTEHKVSADLHEGLDSTLLILKYRLKANDYRPDIRVMQNYGELPLIECFPSQLNQVFMNILANAIDMFDDMAQQTHFNELEANPQIIAIQTAVVREKSAVKIQIRDNGKGMSEATKARVFDHLFTTKDIGKGTGLGLTIARQIVEEKHGGTIEFQSELGQGTEFCIQLPISDQHASKLIDKHPVT